MTEQTHKETADALALFRWRCERLKELRRLNTRSIGKDEVNFIDLDDLVRFLDTGAESLDFCQTLSGPKTDRQKECASSLPPDDMQAYPGLLEFLRSTESDALKKCIHDVAERQRREEEDALQEKKETQPITIERSTGPKATANMDGFVDRHPYFSEFVAGAAAGFAIRTGVKIALGAAVGSAMPVFFLSAIAGGIAGGSVAVWRANRHLPAFVDDGKKHLVSQKTKYLAKNCLVGMGVGMASCSVMFVLSDLLFAPHAPSAEVVAPNVTPAPVTSSVGVSPLVTAVLAEPATGSASSFSTGGGTTSAAERLIHTNILASYDTTPSYHGCYCASHYSDTYWDHYEKYCGHYDKHTHAFHRWEHWVHTGKDHAPFDRHGHHYTNYHEHHHGYCGEKNHSHPHRPHIKIKTPYRAFVDVT